MSALGQKQTSRSEIAMSALPPKADIAKHCWDVRFVPKADSRTAANTIATRSPLRRPERRIFLTSARSILGLGKKRDQRSVAPFPDHHRALVFDHDMTVLIHPTSADLHDALLGP
jgi:hypothetical protein